MNNMEELEKLKRPLSIEEMREIISYYRILCGFLFCVPGVKVGSAEVDCAREKLRKYGEESIWSHVGVDYIEHKKQLGI